jgi:glycosyltransferase involved in cell wall biosynthesis
MAQASRLTSMSDSTTLRVLHAIGTSEAGGTERFLVDLLPRHRAMAIDSFVCVLDAPGRLADEYRAVASRVEHLNLPASFVAGARRWRRCVRDLQPDVLVLYGLRANLLGRLFRGGPRRAAIVAALRSTVVDEHGRAGAGRLDRLTFGRVDVCVSNSRSALDTLVLQGYPRERLSYIAPGVDIRRFASRDRQAARRTLGVRDDTPVLLCVANLKPVKNHALLLRASAILVERGITHRLWVVGDGPERERLESFARELRLDGTITFAGHEPDPIARYRAADVFVLASHWEGTPNAVLEAMAAGLPVVAPPVGDLADLIIDNVTGRLVAADDAESFACGVSDVLHPSRRTSFGNAARSRAAEFDADVAAERYAELFHWATTGKQRRMPFAYNPALP